MNNPYVILGIKESATDSEIRMALKRQINTYCSMSNESKKNSDGDYLQQIFVQAARDLIDKNKRREIDEYLKSEREKYAIKKYSCKNQTKSDKKDFTNNSKTEVIKRKENIEKKENEKKFDVSKLQICVYDKKSIGLFKTMEWMECGWLFDSAGYIYLGVGSDRIGMRITLKGGMQLDSYEMIGNFHTVNNKLYIANCNIEKEIGFDNMRLILYKKGLIQRFTFGEATNDEIFDVICHAMDYFNLTEEKSKAKKKNK